MVHATWFAHAYYCIAEIFVENSIMWMDLYQMLKKYIFKSSLRLEIFKIEASGFLHSLVPIITHYGT